MIRKLRRALPRRTVLLIALAVGLAIFASAGAGADPRPPEPRVAQVDFAPTGATGIADALCLQRGPDGPRPC